MQLGVDGARPTPARARAREGARPLPSWIKALSIVMTAAALAAVLAAGTVAACVGGPLPAERRYQRKQAQAQLARLEEPGHLIGEFTLAGDGVLDGDTVKVEGLGSSMRLLAIDTEETFKRASERRAFSEGWERYLAKMQGDSKRPVKMATPLGEDAKKFAKKFFSGVNTVRLERDHPKEIRGFYNRYLAYVFAWKDGMWVNYNLECVRAGMSPYFTKYGYSRRFHADFVAAQEEARKAERGISDPRKKHYPDYEERLVWWNARAEFVRQFEADAQGQGHMIVLTQWDSMRRLEEMEGKEVVVLGVVGEIRRGDRGPTRVMLARRRTSSFPLIFFDKDVFLSSGVARFAGEYIRARGVVSRYRSRHSNREQLQIVVNLPGQIMGPESAPAPRPAATTSQPARKEHAKQKATATP